jgi:YesN/AraC family two-component response regulator
MYKLALIDDETLILNGLCEYYPWNDLGFKIAFTSESGRDFLDAIKSGLHVDVVLCDISMPKPDGIELAKTLSEDYPDITVVFLSGYADFSYAQLAVHYNVFEYLLKPAKYDEIVSTFTKIKLELDRRNGIFVSEFTYYKLMIQKIHNIARENLKNASRRLIASEMRMSESYLSFLYKKQTGINLNDFLLGLRMEVAMDKLNNSDMKIYEIAEMVGYSNPKNFSRAFSQHFYKSPREIRTR